MLNFPRKIRGDAISNLKASGYFSRKKHVPAPKKRKGEERVELVKETKKMSVGKKNSAHGNDAMTFQS